MVSHHITLLGLFKSCLYHIIRWDTYSSLLRRLKLISVLFLFVVKHKLLNTEKGDLGLDFFCSSYEVGVDVIATLMLYLVNTFID